MSKTEIIIIDDHRIVRKGLKELIENLGDYKVVDEYENGLSFVNALPGLIKIPQLFIVDYSMAKLNGLEVLKHAQENYPDYKFLLLTQAVEEDIINAAYENGARGFLHKTCSAMELKKAIDDIVQYGYSNVSDILKRMQKPFIEKNTSNPQIDLSQKELEFLEYVCNESEYTYQQIAEKMNLSIKSIDKYRADLFDKLNVKSKVGLVLYAYKNQLTNFFSNKK
jgi:DNA-binding NarL/FixJ family response regulator